VWHTQCTAIIVGSVAILLRIRKPLQTCAGYSSLNPAVF